MKHIPRRGRGQPIAEAGPVSNCGSHPLASDRVSRGRRNLAAVAICGAVIAVGLSICAWLWPTAGAQTVRMLDLTPEDAEAFAESWGAFAAIAAIVLMVLHSFLPIPAEVIAIGNGMMFGWLWGILITWIGAMLGATLSFALARRLGRPLVRRFVRDDRLRRIDSWTNRPGTLLALRLVPLISFNMVNYGAGLSGVRWWAFMWTTAIGILPLTILSVVLGHQLVEWPWSTWLFASLTFVGAWIVWHGVRGRASPDGR